MAKNPKPKSEGKKILETGTKSLPPVKQKIDPPRMKAPKPKED